MNFFKQLSDIAGDMALTIRIQQKNGSMAVSVIPDGVDKIKPLVTSGTPEALDEGFFDAIKVPLEQVKSIVVNADAFDDAKALDKPAKGTDAPASPAKASKKAAPKKAAVKKAASPKIEAPKAVPAVQETKKAEPTALELLLNQ